MKKIELEIVALSHSITKNQSYAVVLGEINGLKRLPIVIGGYEAQAIAVALEHVKPSRPLTHDLFATFLETFSIELLEVLIYKLEEGIFYAKLICNDTHGDTVEIDSRTSDALALAVRTGCKIYTYDSILENAVILLEKEETQKTPEENKDEVKNDDTLGLSNKTVEELEQMLAQVLEQEDYTQAIKIRDEISKRK